MSNLTQLSLWESEQQVPENFLECIHYDGSREIVSTLDPSWDRKDKTVFSVGWTTRQAYEDFQRKKGKP